MKNKPIGVFDSGVGGITVLRELRKLMPKENYIYFGDTGRLPYGYKPREVVTEYSVQISRFLRRLDVKALVIACNTANAVAGSVLEDILDIPVIGVIKSAAKIAVTATKNNRIGVIGTQNTIDSGMHKQEILKVDSQIRVYCSPTPLLVSYIEEDRIESEGLDVEIKRGIAPLIQNGIDTLILGCTHYPLIIKNIQRIVGEEVSLIDPAKDTAQELYECLKKRNALSSQNGGLEFYTTGKTEQFSYQLIRLGLSDWHIRQVGITNLKERIFVQKAEEYQIGEDKK